MIVEVTVVVVVPVTMVINCVGALMIVMVIPKMNGLLAKISIWRCAHGAENITYLH